MLGIAPAPSQAGEKEDPMKPVNLRLACGWRALFAVARLAETPRERLAGDFESTSWLLASAAGERDRLLLPLALALPWGVA